MWLIDFCDLLWHYFGTKTMMLILSAILVPKLCLKWSFLGLDSVLSTAPDWLNTVIDATASEGDEKAKPPNVKSITKGRAVLNGEKNEQSWTEAHADRTTIEDDTEKQNINAEAKEDTDTKTEEKPKSTIWDWLYLAVIGGFSVYAIIIGVKVAIKIHRAAKGK